MTTMETKKSTMTKSEVLKEIEAILTKKYRTSADMEKAFKLYCNNWKPCTSACEDCGGDWRVFCCRERGNDCDDEEYPQWFADYVAKQELSTLCYMLWEYLPKYEKDEVRAEVMGEEEDTTQSYICHKCCLATNQNDEERDKYDPFCKDCYDKMDDDENKKNEFEWEDNIDEV